MPVDVRRTVLALGAALTLLLLTAPRPSSALALLAHPRASSDPTAPLVAGVALLAWVVALWLACVTVLVLAAQAPGLLGRAAAAVARRTAPGAVRRTLEVALGVSVTVGALGAPATAAAGPGRPTAAPAGQASAAAPALPSLDWPELPQPPASPTADATPAIPADTATAGGHGDGPRPTEAPAAAGRPAPSPAPVPASGAARGAGVVVRPGDCLWALAEAHLERTGTAAPTVVQVAAAWPRWWAANRLVVGDDPDLIRPGTVLRPPPP